MAQERGAIQDGVGSRHGQNHAEGGIVLRQFFFKGYTPQKLKFGTQKLVVWVDVSPFQGGNFWVPAVSLRGVYDKIT